MFSVTISDLLGLTKQRQGPRRPRTAPACPCDGSSVAGWGRHSWLTEGKSTKHKAQEPNQEKPALCVTRQHSPLHRQPRDRKARCVRYLRQRAAQEPQARSHRTQPAHSFQATSMSQVWEGGPKPPTAVASLQRARRVHSLPSLFLTQKPEPQYVINF